MLTKLTPQQKQQLPIYADKYIQIGLSTDQADFTAAKQAVKDTYKLLNLKQPKIIQAKSPIDAFNEATKILNTSQVESQVWSQVRSQVGSQVGSQVWLQVGLQVRSQVWSQVESQVGSQVYSQVGLQIESQVQSQVQSQVLEQVESQVGLQVESHVGDNFSNNLYLGQFHSDAISDLTFYKNCCGIRFDNKLTLLKQLITTCGWIWWHEDLCIIIDRPSIISQDQQGELHSNKGPAIKYHDGWKLYYNHGELVNYEELLIKKLSGIATQEELELVG